MWLRQKWEETTHVLAAAARSTRIAAEEVIEKIQNNSNTYG
jgi:hypothetical protein